MRECVIKEGMVRLLSERDRLSLVRLVRKEGCQIIQRNDFKNTVFNHHRAHVGLLCIIQVHLNHSIPYPQPCKVLLEKSHTTSDLAAISPSTKAATCTHGSLTENCVSNPLYPTEPTCTNRPSLRPSNTTHPVTFVAPFQLT